MVIESVLAAAGTSFGLGAVSGYAIKKVLKIVAVIAGLGVLILAFLAYNRTITVNWTVLQSQAYNTTMYVYHYGSNVIHQAAGNMHDNSVVTIFGATGVGFVAGFLLGFSRG